MSDRHHEVNTAAALRRQARTLDRDAGWFAFYGMERAAARRRAVAHELHVMAALVEWAPFACENRGAAALATVAAERVYPEWGEARQRREAMDRAWVA